MMHEEEPSSGCVGLLQGSRNAKSHQKPHLPSLPGWAPGWLEPLVVFGAGLGEINSFQQSWKMSLSVSS